MVRTTHYLAYTQSELLEILAFPTQNLCRKYYFYFIIFVKKDFPGTSYYKKHEKQYVETKKYLLYST